ncbi:MAG: T9SS type A sorting domain-containing protein [Bacteroidota bacterium]|nr:T9SS type A sorting domain-containing protein [Bacteroidota bacterium]
MKKLLLIITSLFYFLSNAQINSFQAKGIGGGGALFACAINPANNNEYYISCDMGELFHTTNFGNSYDQVHFKQVIGGHNSKVCFTSSVGLLYGVSYANNMVLPMKSTDNGVTWNALTGNPDNTEETFSIDADYNNPSRVIISYYGAIYFSSNGGNTFTSIHTATNSGSGNVVGGVFWDSNNIYIGTNDGLLVSTNAGTSWSTSTVTGIPAGERIWSFAGAKVGGTTRFFCLTANTADIYVGVVGSDYFNFPKSVYSCDYGSGNWLPKNTGINYTNDFPMFVGMANNDITTVYLAGSNSTGYPDVLKTSNAGAGWSHVFTTATNQNIVTGWSGQGGDRGWGYGECAFGLAVAANDPNKVMFGDFGFVHKTSNGGTTWQQGYVDPASQNTINVNTPTGKNYISSGIENTTCWQVHWNNATSMWSCFSDIKGIRSTDAGNSWSFNYTGHAANSMYRVVQHSNGNLFAGTSNIHDMYQSTRLQDATLDGADTEGKVLYSTNGGAAWQNVHTFGHPVFWIALDPNNVNRAYASVIHYNGGAGMGGIYVCNDLNNLGTSTWTLLPNPPRTEKHPASINVLNDGKMVATYSGRRTSGGAFTASSGVFIYDPALNLWTDVSHTGMYYWTKDLVIDPNDALQNTWYACVFSGWGGPPNGLGGVYKTTNRGTSWTKLTNITDIDRATSLTFNPNNANQVYITGEACGLWMSNNINAVTPTFSIVQSYPFQQPERVFFNPFNSQEVWVTSFGNGMKTGTMSVGMGMLDFASKTDELIIYPNPSSEKINILFNSKMENSSFTILDITGRIVLSGNLPGQNSEVSISGLSIGTYILQVKNVGGMYSTKFFVSK